MIDMCLNTEKGVKEGHAHTQHRRVCRCCVSLRKARSQAIKDDRLATHSSTYLCSPTTKCSRTITTKCQCLLDTNELTFSISVPCTLLINMRTLQSRLYRNYLSSFVPCTSLINTRTCQSRLYSLGFIGATSYMRWMIEQLGTTRELTRAR
eukprot:4159027-Pyramimonas_sp.AAC.1